MMMMMRRRRTVIVLVMSDDVDGYDYMPMKNNGDFNDNIDENKTIISNNFMTHVLETFF